MRKSMILAFVLALCLSGCGAEPGSSSGAEALVPVSSVFAGDCFLCGGGGLSCWGQNNVGIIDLHTFEVMPIEINRYDRHGTLIEENTGCLTFRAFCSGGNRLCASMYEDVDRGHANGSITFNGDAVLDAEQAAAFLCQDCLEAVLSKIYKNGFGAGMINFTTREIQAFEADILGFGLGDYYIDLDWSEPKRAKDSWKADILVCYCPLRYDK